MKVSFTIVATIMATVTSSAVLPRATGAPIGILVRLFDTFSKGDTGGGKAALKDLFSGSGYDGFVPDCNICGFATRLISLQNAVTHANGGQKNLPTGQPETSLHHNEDLFKDNIDHKLVAEIDEFISLFAGSGEDGTSPQCNLCGFQARFTLLENQLQSGSSQSVDFVPARNDEDDFIDNVVHVFKAYFESNNKQEGRKFLAKIYSGEGMDGTSNACNICGFKTGLDRLERQIKTVKAIVKVPSISGTKMSV